MSTGIPASHVKLKRAYDAPLVDGGKRILVDLKVDRLILRHLVVRVNGVDRALGDAQPAVDAFFGIDDQHVFAVAKGIDGTDFGAVRVLAQDAGFGDDVSHGVHGGSRRDQWLPSRSA